MKNIKLLMTLLALGAVSTACGGSSKSPKKVSIQQAAPQTYANLANDGISEVGSRDSSSLDSNTWDKPSESATKAPTDTDKLSSGKTEAERLAEINHKNRMAEKSKEDDTELFNSILEMALLQSMFKQMAKISAPEAQLDDENLGKIKSEVLSFFKESKESLEDGSKGSAATEHPKTAAAPTEIKPENLRSSQKTL